MNETNEHDNPQPTSPQADDAEATPAPVPRSTPAPKTTRKWEVVLNSGTVFQRLHQGTEEQCTRAFDEEIPRHKEGELVLLDPSGTVVDRRVKMRPRKRGVAGGPIPLPVPEASLHARAFGSVLRLEDGIFSALEATPLRRSRRARKAIRGLFRPIKNLLTHLGGDGS